jgi:hypothetical protein
MDFKQIVMPVSKKVNGAFQEVGKVTIHVPGLADLIPFITSAQKKDEKTGALIEEDGIPVYEADEANWLQGAVLAMVKAQARNKLVSGTADLKEGNKIATIWAELCAEGVRDGAGLAIARECKAAFADWLAKQGLSENAVATLNTLFGNKAALSVQAAGVKEKVKARIMSFGESLSEELMEKYNRPISGVLEACDTAAVSTDDL